MQQAREFTKRKEIDPYSSLESSDPNPSSGITRRNKRRKAAAQVIKNKKLKPGNNAAQREPTPSSSSEEATSDSDNFNEPLTNIQFVQPAAENTIPLTFILINTADPETYSQFHGNLNMCVGLKYFNALNFTLTDLVLYDFFRYSSN